MNVKVAYFSAEFGLDESLPIYSGGLGVLAGDHIKAANDLRIPLVGVGIFYRKGYFEQRIEHDGTQAALYPRLNIRQLPIKPVFNAQGERLVVNVPIAGEPVFLQVWAAEIGNVSVYLLDADFDLNREPHRRLTEHLYGGDRPYRISQEIILGIGGVRVLRALGMEPKVWHMNEGHSAFLVLERIREYSAKGIPFASALEAVRASTLFTTHTPVPAGHDVFSLEQMDHFLGDYYWQLGADRGTILGLGRVDQGFNMTRLALRTSSKVNGVSKLHAKVSKQLFHQWTPEIPESDFPVESVTNGVHTPTWLSPFLTDVYDRCLIKDWRIKIADSAVWQRVQAIPDFELWNAHQFAKQRMARELQLPDLSHTLVIGFARRFATYKRALLLFQDVERLKRLVTSIDRPVCFIFAGKAHPADQPGQQFIHQLVEYSKQEPFRGRIFFISNYQMGIAKQLVQGVDVWLNTPVKPMEASGTSGQKAALNGVLNCSVLDGWWAEGFNGKNGWAIAGATDGSLEPQDRDRMDSGHLYQLLEEQIAPLYYRRDDGLLPRGWITMMKESIQSLTPVYSTHRMVAEYSQRMYEPLAARGQRHTQNHFEIAKRVADYKRFIRENWHHVQFDSVERVEAKEYLTVHASIQLGPMWHRDLLVEIMGSDGYDSARIIPMEYCGLEANGAHTFAGIFPGTQETWKRSRANIRVIPVSPDFSSKSEMELICWWKS